MIGFTMRNLTVFFKDKSAVFFSLLSVFIVIGLYVVFLGETLSSGFNHLDGARYLMDSWIVAGLLAITSVTTAMGAFGIMVEDKSNKIIKDFVSSPIKNTAIVGGYILSAMVISIIMSLVTLVLSELYIISNGGQLLVLSQLIKVFLLIILTTMTNVSIVLFIVSFFNSSNAFTTASTVIGTLIGFVTGVYLPIGQLPESVQLVVKCFPISHASALFRQIMTATPLDITFADAPTDSILAFNQSMGTVFTIGDHTITTIESVMVLVATSILFYGLSVVNIRRKFH